MKPVEQSIHLRYTDDYNEACRLRDQGFEPIECAFGSYGSVLGELAMDHHGTESWREGVAIRACRDHYGARQDDPRFVVTGNADADAVLAIIALAALVPQSQIPQEFYTLVNDHDTDPIRLDLLDLPYGDELLSFLQIEHLRRDQSSFHRAIEEMMRLLLGGLQHRQRTTIRRREEHRIQMAEESYLEAFGRSILFVASPVWGFDRWYRKAPLIVSYSQRASSITLGCRDHQAATELLGEGGLLSLFPLLGQGWGGREAIGGSPRGIRFTLDEARDIAQKIQTFLDKKMGK